MKRFVTLIMVLVLTAVCSAGLQAQRFGAPESMKGKLIVGGNIGAGYYGSSLSLAIAPQVGYRLTRNLEVGARLGYQMNFHSNYYSAYGRYFNHVFSGALYANYEIFAGIYAHIEDEEVGSFYSGPAITSSEWGWYNNALVGLGYRQYSGRSYAFTTLLYNLSWDYMDMYNNIYVSPFVIRVGFCFALDGKKR